MGISDFCLLVDFLTAQAKRNALSDLTFTLRPFETRPAELGADPPPTLNRLPFLGH